MFRIAVCDDNVPITSEVEHLLTDISRKDNISLTTDIFFDGLSLYHSIESGLVYDLIYLDIEMEKLDGIHTAHLIRRHRLPSLLIYISAYDNYYRQLFEVEPFRFLSKPIDSNLFYQYFKAAQIRLNKQKLFYTFSFNQITTKVTVSDIIFIESEKRNIVIHTLQRQYRFIGKLNDVESFFTSDGLNFLRIHQSYIINPYYVSSICLSEVTMSNNRTLHISARYQEQTRDKYLHFIEEL